MNRVFVLDTDKRPLEPCRPARARQMLDAGEAAVFRRFPFTIILKKAMPDAVVGPLTAKFDPGSKATGLALVDGAGRVVFAAELAHRGGLIKKKLEQRRAVRRGRRNRNTRYRQPRFLNRRGRKGLLAPSLQHRVGTTMTWLGRFRRLSNIGAVSVERVKFDTQLMQDEGISGAGYQQGTLAGYTVREYLLEKWGRACAYCGKTEIPLQIEHITPKSRGGTNRASNLALACQPCNQKKGSSPVDMFLKARPDLLKKIKAQAKTPLRDAAAVNATREAIFSAMSDTGLPVEAGDGAQTKFNRANLGLPKAHWIDAACVGESGAAVTVDPSMKPLLIAARGQGTRQKAVLNKFGYPIQHRALKPVQGWRNGDVALFEGKAYSVTPRQKGSFELTGHGKPFSRPVAKLTKIFRFDGYRYA